MTGLLLTLLTPLGPFALLLLMAVAFAETGLLAGILLPGDTLMVTAGVLVAAGALRVPVWLSLVAITLAAAAGDQVAFLVGRHVGPGMKGGAASRFISAERLESARVLFERHGAKAVVLSRFVPLTRTVTPVLAGVAGMNRRRFLVHNLAGATAWAAVMFGGGYWLGAIPLVSSHLELIVLSILIISATPALGATLRARAGRQPQGGIRILTRRLPANEGPARLITDARPPPGPTSLAGH
ncbi:DedA family protein [Terrabacter sp. Ter38]|uniref:DedA family protein n=1 Tax=Terrabacter sp. Ter38 TaxID=2926030 RepID=UPI00211845A7|nr:DedA family protein [Terrabacter sp. Ter38]